ncbi:RHS repeat-associated core domain-containing protein [Acinetobacter baumannii]|uniref:RHS repeat-associated core domain-containing protein n=1 Tax=Acinetobacter baumannii TaxID=470 RepID=UPI000446C056|nr:RHS repeat-associated core domain-containing protein [Acinetobacter baumannii]EXD52247.1 RHS repeat-associated core domain protein [Acinetobacter baumannii 781407]EXE28930.1 RHS repeat-associated core domain protein [Acinetobacter baumannii 1525283]MDO7527170.1 RHS repeat-associated core domain-containing protein [Acinetobacter baumannii]TPS66618.1 RHS repeat protein [Acinetobacter baumannii]HAV5295518.1 RHS repeat protein [Acinetobacter baumannii]
MAKENTQQKEIKKQPAVELAVFNLNSVTDVADLQMVASQVQRYLQVCGNTSLEQIKSKANITTVANIFALTGSVLDLMLFATDKKTGDAAVQRGALLAANLIGLFSEPSNEAHARMALRPMFGLMAECLYRENGKIKETDIKRLGLHLNAMIAGDLENFLKETQAKLSSLLNSAATLGVTILQSMATPATGINAGITTAAGASAEKRDPKLKFTNWAVPLIDLLGKPSQANLTPKIQPNITSRLQQEATQAIAALSQTLQQQANADQKYTLAWLLQETLKAIQALENKGNASVPVNQTGEYERHTKGDTLEFVSLQADALNAPPCEGADSQSGKSISYSIGAERVQHADFYLPKIGFSFIRQYNSQMDEFDQSMVGARWMMPFSNMIQRTAQGYLFIDSKGRKHQLPASITFETYEVPYEGIIVQPLKNGDLVLNFGGDWTFQFHQFSVGQPYQLIQQFNEKTQEKIDLSYLIFEKVAYLQCVNFQLEHAKHQLKFAFNEQVKIMAVFLDDNAEPLARYDYDTQGNLIKAIDQNGHTRTYEYNYFHQLTRYTDRTGRGQNIRYESTDAKAKAIEEWADDGSFHTKLKWHPRLRQVAVYDAYDVPTYYYFDLNGFTYRTRLADGRESWYSRDGKKRITRQIDFEGRETQQEYNDQDQLVKIVQPNGGIIHFAYNEQGNLVEIKDPEGSIWKREYDENGNLSKEINPLGHITQYKYNNDNQLVEVIDAKGGVKKIQYNELGQMISYTDCSGKSSTWEYDEDGALTAQQTANNKVVQYFYSTKGRDKGQLQSIIYPDGLKEYFEHDEEGRLLKHIDTKGLVTEYKYNQVGLLEQRIDANRHSVTYQWDKQGRIQKLINQNQAEYLFGYNPYGYLILEQAFDGEEKHYSYNENGRLFQIRQPNILTEFDYYADGQIASKSFTHLHTGQKQTEQFDYNLNSQLSRASNEVSQIDFYRNALGQLVREHQHYKIPELKPLTAVLHYEYDELGNLIKTIRPDGHTLNHLVYGSGHIYAIGLNNQEVASFQRDDLHRETTRLLANGLIQTKQYNDVGLLSSQLIQPEQETQDYLQYQAHRHYQYDQNYLLSQVEDSRLGRLNYQYDPIGRLIAAQSLHKTESFNFDPAGNLIDSDSVLSPAQIKNNLIKSYKGKHYQYDAQGNVTEIIQAGKNLKLTWDNQNRLIRSDNNGLVTEYGYDVFGRRLYKKTTNELTLFGWDGDLMIWESVKSAQMSYTKHYIYEPNSFVPLLQGGYKDFIQLIETPDYQEYQTKPYSIYKDPVWNSTTRKKRADLEQITFYHCDQVGTPQTMTNTRGECVWEILQDTWGTALEIKVVNQDNPFEQNNLRFQGQYYDSETELHYNRYRYYEPHSARYVSKDPIGLEGGMNTSSYVSDPNQWIDPEGLNSFNYGEMFGIPASAQAGIAYQGQRNYDCWLKTGKQCELAIEPLFDYVICSGGFSAFGGSKIYNLHNGNVYTAGGVSLTGVKDMKDHAQTVGDIAKKSIDKSFKVGPANLSKLKKMFSGSCMAGYILNKPSGLTNSKATDEFLTGMGISQSIGWWGARIGVTTPAGSFFDRNGPVGIEAGIGTPGVDISVSDSKPTLVRTQD